MELVRAGDGESDVQKMKGEMQTPEQLNYLSEMWDTMDCPELSMLFKWTAILTITIFYILT